MKTPVFAVDVGYGNTKYAYRATRGAVTTGIFPSLAPLAASRALSDYGVSVLFTRKVAMISIEGIEYEVGPDVPITAAYGRTGRALADDYVSTDNYAALLFGALHFAGVTHIERLVLGLSLHNMETYSAQLKEFPRAVIELIDSACLANAHGFLLVGEAGLARERGAA
ncbi:hypothetical protein [Paraburkholderia sp. J11-2]|uniref:ParM/StbA family protein n=1 Tax=Paraburkholderia sp. J11-2 TaxID=2805431 RepID=UPI002AB79BCA|nr:hypothetical protein [Paraburkholderia sp. J11-2]